MLTVIKEVVMALLSVVMLAYGSSYGLKTLYHGVRDVSLNKVSKGLSPLSSFTEKMTCLRYDQNFKETRIKTGSCRGY